MKGSICQAWFRQPGTRAILLASALLTACGEQPAEVAELTGRTMGTGYSIKLSPAPGPAVRASLRRQVEQRLNEINRQMSTYLPDSDLSRFNQTQNIDWQPQPVPVVELVEQARHVSRTTGGRYDITVGPLVNLWGFGNSGSRETPPTPEQIADVLQRIGYRQLETRHHPAALRKGVPGLEVDLSSIAKGWAVDQMAQIIQAEGINNFLVEIGGELRAQGEKASGKPWRIAVEQPSYENRSVQRVIVLKDTAMATSGDYRNFFTDGGRLYSHTIDPLTGQPVQHRLASVSVLAGDCATADAWATALLALGEQQALELADSQGIKALFIIRSESGLTEKTSRALTDSRLLDSH